MNDSSVFRVIVQSDEMIPVCTDRGIFTCCKVSVASDQVSIYTPSVPGKIIAGLGCVVH